MGRTVMSSVDRFEIQGELGRGESSVVYRARDRLTDRLVAIKMFQRRSHESGQFDGLAARLEREARLLSRVKHSSVVEVIEARLSEEGAWLVTEYIEGESLQELLRRRERLAPEEAISLAAQAARALSCAHRNHLM